MSCECGCGGQPQVSAKTNLARGITRGVPYRFVHGHQARVILAGRLRVASAKRYRILVDSEGVYSLLHRTRAVRALGKPLPAGAVVHHADGSRRDDAPLVICQDEAYHKLLHWRMRVKAAGGNPNTDKICAGCRVPCPRSSFRFARSQPYGLSAYCHECAEQQKAKKRKMA